MVVSDTAEMVLSMIMEYIQILVSKSAPQCYSKKGLEMFEEAVTIQQWMNSIKTKRQMLHWDTRKEGYHKESKKWFIVISCIPEKNNMWKSESKRLFQWLPREGVYPKGWIKLTNSVIVCLNDIMSYGYYGKKISKFKIIMVQIL